MNAPNPGWFPDPMGRHQFRYWDGGRWSDHVSDGGQTAIDPLSAPQSPSPAADTSHPLPPPSAAQSVAAAQPLAATPPASPPTRKRSAIWVIVGALAAVAAVVVALVFVVGGKDDDSSSDTAAELFLEPATAAGDDPFTPSVDTNTAPPPVRIVPVVNAQPAATTTTTSATTVVPSTVAPTTTPTTPTPTATPTTAAGAVLPVRSVDATAPGLYGGTRNNRACDQEQMITFLTQHPEKAAAWAGAQGIAPADIPAFIRSLTPMVLRADTRVTNFGFRNGVANAKAAVLQAGTAVLVDQYGIPRARCSCGNPLAPPRPLPGGYTYHGDPWPGFDPTAVIVVVNVNNVVINNFVVVDLNGGYFGRTPPKASPNGDVVDGEVYVDTLCDMFPDAPECLPPVDITVPPETIPATTLPEPVLGTGDVQFTLRWSSTADLDLAVLDPAGEEISYGHPTSASGGTLDVDSNASCENPVTNPVENVFWPTGASPLGVYQVRVYYYEECAGGSGPQPFTITAMIDGVEVPLQAAGLRMAVDTLSGANDSRTYSVEKTASPPMTVPPTVAPTEPPTVPPTVTTPTSHVPVTTAVPIGVTPTTVQPGQALTLEEVCAAQYPPPVIGAANPWYTLCMHDPTVT
ncbi:MAG: DUF2510 domain-containing protein [Actinobacteria bacterium]|nr:DUF2510 domain-containing protein [Actinomycetota bacterium]